MKQLVSRPALLAAFAFTACQTGTPPDRFALADVNGDGRLSRDEISDSVATRNFNSRDANKDGKMTPEEWLVPGDEAGPVQFRERDANKDGIVTLEEAKAFARRGKASADLMREADTNRDGSVDRAEATAYYGKSEG